MTDGEEVVKSEIKLWQTKWNGVEIHEKPKNALEALDKCDHTFFPNIHYFLKVLASLPVTSCSSERSFSTLRQLKNYLRNTVSEERLTSLAVLYVHRNYPVDVDSVIEKFISIKRRRMTFCAVQ
ncbi:52 kDa repressor of the inhibitor of the protein kinase [Folsomia candida]|uniref:52 kDa repressor of the inhibitor of the protein kinase n=1 Tax=Folsomia candida TaxID=158441 RepID=A0A226DLB8_FOLCA|nr:52 kDa repressor of the inhibitor of the protein kinase [Folsomia candida]